MEAQPIENKQQLEMSGHPFSLGHPIWMPLPGPVARIEGLWLEVICNAEAAQLPTHVVLDLHWFVREQGNALVLLGEQPAGGRSFLVARPIV